MQELRVAHLTDLHLPVPGRVRAAELWNKRALGLLSWRRKRWRRHKAWALEVLADDPRMHDCDMRVVTGDIVNIALPAEFEAAEAWLNARFDPAKTLYAPGNHDAYVPVDWEDGLGRLAAYMRGMRGSDPAQRPPTGPEDFPFVRVAGEVCFIVANSSPPTAPGLATGRLGKGQLDRLRRELETARARGLCRVLAIHHPVERGIVSRRKGLDDGPALRALLAETGVELVVHGHAHKPSWGWLNTPDGPRPVAGGGSASHPAQRGAYRPARYNIFTIGRSNEGDWRIHAEVRELDPETRSMRTAEERQLL